MIDAESKLALLQIGAEWLTNRAGGLNRYTHGLSHALAASEIRQHWLVMGDEAIPTERIIRVQAVASPKAPLRKRFAALRVATRKALVDSPDVVTSHFALYAFPVRHLLASRPHVVHFHGPWAAEAKAEGAPRWKTWLQYNKERAVYARADRVVTLSQAFARIAIEDYGVPESKVRIVPGGINAQQFDTGRSRAEARKALDLPTDRPIVVCVRRLARRMGLENLIEAIAEVTRSHPDVLLLIGGKGSLEKELQQRIQQRQLSQHVRLLGFVPDEDLPLLYRAGDLSIVPTQSLEGFGLITLESLAAGTPVLVTPVGGLPEVVRDLDPGLVMSGAEVGTLTATLSEALNGNLALPDSAACQEYVRTRFDWSVIVEQVLGVYHEAVDAHG